MSCRVSVNHLTPVRQLHRSRDSRASLAFTARRTGPLGVADGPR
jgi:hypothetical protein